MPGGASIERGGICEPPHQAGVGGRSLHFPVEGLGICFREVLAEALGQCQEFGALGRGSCAGKRRCCEPHWEEMFPQSLSVNPLGTTAELS